MKTRHFSLFNLLAVAAFLMLAGLFLPVYAQTSGQLTISPPEVVLSANPGDTKTVTFTTNNSYDQAKILGVEFRNFKASDESGNPLIINDSSYTQGIQTWLSGPATLPVGPKSSATYTANIPVPKTAATGTYYGLVVFKPPAENGSISASVASIVLVNVGHITQQISIESFSTDGVITDAFGKLDGNIVVRIKNIGNGYTTPKLEIDILDSGGKNVSAINANKNDGGVLPGTIRKFTIPVSNSLDPNKTYKVRLIATPQAGKALTSEKSLPRPTTPIERAPKPKSSLLPIIVGAITAIILGALALVGLKKRRRNKAVSLPMVDTAQLPNALPPATIPPTINSQPNQTTEEPPDKKEPFS